MHTDMLEQDWGLLYVENRCTCRYHPVDMKVVGFEEPIREKFLDIFKVRLFDLPPELGIAENVCKYLEKARYPSAMFVDFLLAPYVTYLSRTRVITEIFGFLLCKQSSTGHDRGMFCYVHGWEYK